MLGFESEVEDLVEGAAEGGEVAVVGWDDDGLRGVDGVDEEDPVGRLGGIAALF